MRWFAWLIALAVINVGLTNAVLQIPGTSADKEAFEKANAQLIFITQDNFTESIAVGDWFIFFGRALHIFEVTSDSSSLRTNETHAYKTFSFVPLGIITCGHCVRIHLIGMLLTLDRKTLDLCEGDEFITRFPTLRFYRNGVRLEQYSGMMEAANVLPFVDNLMNPGLNSTTTTTTATTSKLATSDKVPDLKDLKGDKPKDVPLIKPPPHFTKFPPTGKTPSTLDTAVQYAKSVSENFAGVRPNVNKYGKVVPLTDKTIPILVNNTDWFIMFHAPWCSNCQLMGAIWKELATSMKGKINIGSVDVSKETATAAKYGARALPSFVFLSEPYTQQGYTGKNTLAGFEAYLNGFFVNPFKVIVAENLTAILKTNPVAAFYVYNPETLQQADFESFAMAAQDMHGEIPIYVSPDQDVFKSLRLDTWTSPQLIIVKDGIHQYPYRGILKDQTEMSRLNIRRWLHENKFASLTALDTSNSPYLLGQDNLVVVIAVDPLMPETAAILNEAREAAVIWNQQFVVSQKGRRNPVYFTWVDAKEKPDYVYRVFGITAKQLPKMLVLETREDKYYPTDRYGVPFKIERTRIVEDLLDIVNGNSKHNISDIATQFTAAGIPSWSVPKILDLGREANSAHY
ncbi:hypothetical protein HDU76_001294, partial [Blyttiomyces sp. JEL0837]